MNLLSRLLRPKPHGPLNDTEIAHLCETANLITPFTSRRLDGHGYDLTLGKRFLAPRRPSAFDGETAFEEITSEGATILPNAFVLAEVEQRLHLPPDIIGFVSDKSSFARKGLSVFNTKIKAGWSGWLTLELRNNGPFVLELRAGTPICHVTFFRGAPATRPYSGRYQHQLGVTAAQP